jgi:hypothetical protein
VTSPAVIRFWLSARVSSAHPAAVKAVLVDLLPPGSVSEMKDDLLLEAELEGESAKDLNRLLLSALRKVEKKTRLRAQWTTAEGTTQSFFDYVLKKTTTN